MNFKWYILNRSFIYGISVHPKRYTIFHSHTQSTHKMKLKKSKVKAQRVNTNAITPLDCLQHFFFNMTHITSDLCGSIAKRLLAVAAINLCPVDDCCSVRVRSESVLCAHIPRPQPHTIYIRSLSQYSQQLRSHAHFYLLFYLFKLWTLRNVYFNKLPKQKTRPKITDAKWWETVT